MQRFFISGIAIFNSWAQMLKNSVFDGFSLWQLYLVGLLFAFIGIIWGFDLD